MKELLRKEIQESLTGGKLVYNLISLAVMGFVLWNFATNLPQFTAVYRHELGIALVLLPSYLVTFLALLLIKNFLLEKKLGILEAMLATGVTKVELSLARSVMVLATSVIQAVLLLLFIEFMFQRYCYTSVTAYLDSGLSWLLLGVLVIFSAACIWMLVSVVLCFSYLANYLLLLAFALFFLYAGFYYLLTRAAVALSLGIFGGLTLLLIYASLAFLKAVPNDRIIMD